MPEQTFDPARVRRAYDTVAGLYAEQLPDTSAESSLELAMLEAFVEAVDGGRVLDAGCGTGRVSRYVADRGCRVEGFDLSPGMVAQARRTHPDLAFAVGDVRRPPFADATYDGVLLWYSLIHLPTDQLPGVLGRMRRLLRPQGSVLVAFQAGTARRDVAGFYRRHGHEITLERQCHDPDEMARALTTAGFGEVARSVRAGRGGDGERDGQACLLARLT